ncbi:MAG: carbohydrate kinase family protein, partial [Candidatus Acidiferrales bacterium]
PYIRQAKHLHTEASQLPMAPVLEAIRIARSAGVQVVFDLDVPPEDFLGSGIGTEADLVDALKMTDILKPCKAAARALSGETDPEKMAAKLLSLGPKTVAITMGSEGCLIATQNQRVREPAFSVRVVDTTGAGDAFMGGLSYALLQSWPLDRVGLFANACAALCCTKVGARAMARRPEVEALMASKTESSVIR